MRRDEVRAGAAVLVGLLVAAALTACSGDDPSGGPKDASPSRVASSRATPTTARTSATPSPAPTRPVLPAAAKEHTAAGAEAFARYWFEASNYAYSTGDTTALQNTSTSDCDACGEIIRTVDDQYASGGHFEGGEVSILDAGAPPPDGSGTVVSVVLDESVLQEVDSSGSAHMIAAKHLPQILFAATWGSDGWLAVEIADESKP